MGLIRFLGPDAATFLQGQVSNDTSRLSAGSPIFAAYSTPQGRVVALTHLLPHSSGIMALLPQDILLPTLKRLRKFVMRAKVNIEDVSEQFFVHGMPDATSLAAAGLNSADPALEYWEQNGSGVARLGGSGALGADQRFWVISAAQAAPETAAAGAADTSESTHRENAWRLGNIRAGLPQVYAATCEMFVAQMLNLDLIGGISFSKGCYTGQEIIARTQHLGRIKRRMFRLRLPAGAWALGQTVHLTDGHNGRLTELAAIEGGFEALAVLNLDVSESTLEAVNAEAATATRTLIAATQLDLPYGLTDK